MKKIEQKPIVSCQNNDWNFLFSGFLLFIVMFFSHPFYGLDKIDEVEKTNTLSLFRIKMQGLPNYLDECVFYYQEGATDGFDSNYDAYKLFGPNPAPHISIDNDSLLMSINGIHPVSQTYSTHILATTHVTGSFTMTATDIQGLSSGTCIYLKDLQTNTTVNLLLCPYVFYLSNTTTSSRFVLTITYNTLPIIASLTQPSCQSLNGGKATMIGGCDGPWNYVWRDTIGHIVKTSLGFTGCDSLYNLINGGYTVEITSAGNACLRNEISFNINEIILPLTSFSSPDSVISSLGNNFSPNNLSSNCSSYLWDFGDGNGISTSFEPSYSYSVSGIYLTKLVGISTTGCKDSVLKPLKIIDFSTHIISKSSGNCFITDLGNNKFKMKFSQHFSNPLFVNLRSIDGKEFFHQVFNENINNEILIDLNHLNAGLYILNLNLDEKNLLSSKIFIKH